MITNVYYRPQAYTSGFNPIPYSFASDKWLKTDFVYVVDIVINNTTTYRIKQRPNPQGICVIDISSIVQPSIRLTEFAAEAGYPLPFANAEAILASVYLMVGEEYIDNPAVSTALVIYDGNGNIGEPDYFIGANLTKSGFTFGSIATKVLPASLPFNQSQFNLASTAPYGYWAEFIMDGDGKFLSRNSSTVDVEMGQYHTLSFINWDWQQTQSFKSQVQLIKVDYTTATGGTGTQIYQNIISNGGGPAPVATYTSATESREFDLLTFQCGPETLFPTGPTMDTYTVTAFYKATATTSQLPNTVASETITFRITENCFDLYPTVRLSWLNDLGGRDYWNFTMFYEKATSTSGEGWNQTQLNWSGTTPVALDTDANTTGNWLRGGDKAFNQVVTTTAEIQTDWLTQEQVDFLGDIPASPQVWAYIGKDKTPYTVKLTTPDYTYKTIKQVKMAQATFQMTYTKTQQKQNL